MKIIAHAVGNFANFSLKVQSFKLKKHWQMIASVFQKYYKNFALQLL